MIKKPEMSHITCTEAEYKAMKSHPASTLYFLYDTSQIFKGDQEFCPPDGVGDKLPSVTSEDDGKILGVENGHWDKVDPSSGGDNLVAICPVVLNSGMTLDLTCAQLYSKANCKFIMFVANNGGYKGTIGIGTIVYVNRMYTVTFTMLGRPELSMKPPKTVVKTSSNDNERISYSSSEFE